MEKYVPYMLFASVLAVAAVGMIVSMQENATANAVIDRSCKSVNSAWTECTSENGGCPQKYPPYKQWGIHIANVPKCCCAPLKTERNFKYGQSLYK